MNQILLTEKETNNRKNNKRSGNRDNSNDMKKIIIVFAAIILVFGIGIAGIYGYNMFKNKKDPKPTNPELTLALESNEDSEEVIIIAKSEVGISKIVYTWNDDEVVEKELNGRTEQKETVKIPEGENTLKVEIFDLNGQTKQISETFIGEEILITDSDKIEINASVIEVDNAKKLKIVATSELPIEYLTYKCNDEEEVKIESDNQELVLETMIALERGDYEFAITVKDIENNANSTNVPVSVRLRPEINVYRENNKLYMEISHDMGFEKIEFYINGNVYAYDENFSGYDPEKEYMKFDRTLQEGENIVIIKAVSNEKTEYIYTGKCDYIP